MTSLASFNSFNLAIADLFAKPSSNPTMSQVHPASVCLPSRRIETKYKLYKSGIRKYPTNKGVHIMWIVTEIVIPAIVAAVVVTIVLAIIE